MASSKSKERIITCKDDLNQRIRMFRLRKGLMQGQLGRLIGVGANAITAWESGSGHPTATKIKPLCMALDITPDELFGFPRVYTGAFSEDEKQLLNAYKLLAPEDRAVALAMLTAFSDKRAEQQTEKDHNWLLERYLRINKNSLKVSAGTGEPLWDHRGLSYVYLKRSELTEAADEIITVHGDSMEPKLHDGDDLLVKHASGVEYGEIGIFIVDGEGLVKEYRPEGLYSLNHEKYPLIPASGIEGCLCVGKVLGVITPDMLAGQDEVDMLKKAYASLAKKAKQQ